MKNFLFIAIILMTTFQAVGQMAPPGQEMYINLIFRPYSIYHPNNQIDYSTKLSPKPKLLRNIAMYRYSSTDTDSISSLETLMQMEHFRYSKKNAVVESKIGNRLTTSTFQKFNAYDGYATLCIISCKSKDDKSYFENNEILSKYNKDGKCYYKSDKYTYGHDTLEDKSAELHLWHYDIDGKISSSEELYFRDTNICKETQIGRHNTCQQYLYDTKGRLRLVLNLDSLPGPSSRLAMQYLCHYTFTSDNDTQKIALILDLFHFCKYAEMLFYIEDKPVYHCLGKDLNQLTTERIAYDYLGRIDSINCYQPPVLDKFYRYAAYNYTYKFSYHSNGKILSVACYPGIKNQFVCPSNGELDMVIQYFSEDNMLAKEVKQNIKMKGREITLYKYEYY